MSGKFEIIFKYLALSFKVLANTRPRKLKSIMRKHTQNLRSLGLDSNPGFHSTKHEHFNYATVPFNRKNIIVIVSAYALLVVLTFNTRLLLKRTWPVVKSLS
jgi:hypothetical protein